ncbi:MAG: hypothetical protein LBB88_04765 [Planctomycetaceae bacterium]|jgi:hypothetical protein|nr:hypothetical protein [Planctomycetaceae bacterium]
MRYFNFAATIFASLLAATSIFFETLYGFQIEQNQIDQAQLDQNRLEKICRDSSSHYAFMWWVNSIKESRPLQFAVKTDQYAFVFDYEKLNFRNLLVKKENRPAAEILRTHHDTIFNETEIPSLSFGIETGNKFQPCRISSKRTEDCQLIHSGRFLHRRFINRIPDLTGCNPYQSGLDIIAWSDRLTLILRAIPTSDWKGKSIVLQFTVPKIYHELPSTGKFKIFKHAKNKTGYIITTSEKETQMSVSNNTITARLSPLSTSNFQAGKKLQTGLIIYPVSDIETLSPKIIEQENNPVKIIANQTSPVDSNLSVNYDSVMGCHTIKLRNDTTGNVEKDNNRLEKILFTIENTNSHDKTVRLNFSKEGEIFGVTGISAIICDVNGYPTGISVQLSKNWHKVDSKNQGKYLYGGSWFNGLTMFSIPAKCKMTFEYIGVNAHWGGVAAASHSQLCLVGWGHNQQWDESAIGAWGENICYEPDLDQASAPILDMRPLLIANSQGKKWGWTGNVGGADFFNLIKPDGKRAWHVAMKTHYKRYCPNFTEAIYAGEMLDGKVGISYTASAMRSDDITRGIYRIRMDVKKDITFRELNIFQLGAPTYNYSTSKKIAMGDKNGLLSDWKAVNGESSVVGKDESKGESKGENKNENKNKVEMKDKNKPIRGDAAWFCLYDSQISKRQKVKGYIGGDRGFVIRSWISRIGGRLEIPPYWREDISTKENRGLLGDSGSIISLTIPEKCNSLLAGDYIEAEIEIFLLPSSYADYYGTNEYLKRALKKDARTWRLAYREVAGNDIKVTACNEETKVERNYPPIIVAQNDKAHFKINGGIGFVPIIIKGLSSYKIPILYENRLGKWEKIDQSQHGNDFWQTDFDPISETWEIIYNVNMDSTNNKQNNQEFKFELKNQ